MIMTLTPGQEVNIQTYLYTMPADIKENIKECTDKWLNGESAYGYPHPVHVCENIQAANARQPFLSVQQLVDLQFLKNHLRQALQ
ncbi:hypothetical protein M2277_005631 [Paenibacillus sp. LBL]|uniref:hypothetical protein n=1 Tax=Paenibacillus sp. LBL TaxID=2940563 RepID=UPI0024770701|nr:hypothetical protein [Paenibacillus sp. LBL]MDH6674932.1 hypothetical protein [Paenibacillus sp. LBL]